MSGRLSKSLFIRGHQCHKALWLEKFRPELKDRSSESQEARFRSGREVGRLAHELFPGGIEVPYEGMEHAAQIEMTRRLIGEGVKTIYEATFEHAGVFVKVDILNRERDAWAVYEVKASSEVKEVHYYDAALQYFVVRGAGIDVANVCLVHIDTTYTRRGALDVKRLFRVKDITSTIMEMQPNIPPEIADMRAMLSADMPEIDIGPQCSDPYECEFHGHCWAHLPDDSVFDLRGRGVDKFALYRQGIIRQADIPLESLNARQRHQVEATLGQIDQVDKQAVRDFLASLWYPLCFLDFETVNPAIPPFDGLRPYQRIPFQYSLHICPCAGGGLQHREFLGEPGLDPREKLTEHLLREVPEGACIIAWNQAFEKGVLRDLAGLFPNKAKKIGLLVESFRDPMTIFQARSVYLWQQKGSYSIKEVLPALVPELTYKGLDIADGDMAMNAYRAMSATADPREIARLRRALLDYCRVDTLGLVRIHEKLRELAT